MASGKTLEPAPVDLGRVTRYFEMLCRLGMDDVMDEVAKKSRVPSGKPTTSLGGELAIRKDEEAYVAIDVARIWREIGRNGFLIEMACLLFDADEEAVKAVSPDEFRTAFFVLARESHAVCDELTASGRSFA